MVASPSLPRLVARVVKSLLLLADKVVASLNRRATGARAEVRDQDDRVAFKEVKGARAVMERVKGEASMVVASKVTAGEATAAMAKIKVQVMDKIGRARAEASSRAPSPATRSLKTVAPKLTLTPSPHPRRAQGKRGT
jgi:hypothetical protein